MSLAIITLGLLHGNLTMLIGGAITVLIVDSLIDRAGHHTGDDGQNVRTSVTHSVLTGPLWGAVVGFCVGLIVQYIFRTAEILIFVALGAAGAFVHLLLDAGKDWYYRWAPAHTYDIDKFLICTIFIIDILLLPEILRQYIPFLPFAFGVFGVLGILLFGSVALMMLYRMYRMKAPNLP